MWLRDGGIASRLIRRCVIGEWLRDWDGISRLWRRVATLMWGGNGDQGLRLLRNLSPGSDYDIASRLGICIAFD